jgi:release factor glutamine methyltransferase
MTNGNITVAEALKHGVSVLSENKTIETPRLDAEVLLCYVLKCERISLIINKDKFIDKTEEDVYFSFILRRQKNEPVSYITGKKEFMSLNFEVCEGVLIPRPDTEILVEKIIELYKDKEATIVDLCTGSGAIAVSLAHYLKKSKLIAVDKYDICIDCAKRNAINSDVNIKLIKADVFVDFKLDESIDCIVSNPPYIETEVLTGLSEDVKNYEPKYALDGGDDGLIFYRKITDYASKTLKKGGILAYEIGYNQSESVTQIIKNTDAFCNIETVKDLSGLDRVILAEKR